MQRYGQDQTRGRLCNAEGVLHERILYGVISIEDDEFFGLQSFHEEDYQIYYNNIKDNVAKRIAAYKNKKDAQTEAKAVAQPTTKAEEPTTEEGLINDGKIFTGRTLTLYDPNDRSISMEVSELSQGGWANQNIKANNELLATDASRFEVGWGEDPSTLYPDPEKHILAFDLIYCCSTYNLFHGISFERPKLKERQLMQEKKEKAIELSERLLEAKRRLHQLNEAIEYVNSVFSVGQSIQHFRFGEGIIRENDGSRIIAEFSEYGARQLGTSVSVAKGIISSPEEGYAKKMEEYKDLLMNEEKVRSRVVYAEKELALYAEFLE